MKNEQLRKLKYAIVRNITANSTLAQQSRDWSNDRIFMETGIEIAKELKTKKGKVAKGKKRVSHTLIKYDTKDKRNKLKQIIANKEKFLSKKKLSDNDVIYTDTYTRQMDKELLETLKYRTYREIKQELEYRKQFTRKKTHKLNTKEKQSRMDRWSEWSKGTGIDFPYSIKRLAYSINLANNLDINAHYGFGMVYYAFTNNKTPESFEGKYEYDPHTGEYKEAKKS